MERNYLEDFPVNDAQHVVENGKSNYSNMFFHEIDLKYILERLDALSNIATVDDLRLSADGLSVVLSANNEVIDTVNLSTPIESKINEASTALMHELNLVKGRVTVLETHMNTAESDIDDLQANVNGFRYFPAGTDIVGLLDDSPYKDTNGLYVLADSTTGATLLANTSTYKRIDSTEDLHGKVGADTCSPFKGDIELDTLNVTPTTSAQSITPLDPVKGWDEVNVSAVTSNIDSNIQAENIKSGVSILGVTGNYSGGGGGGVSSFTRLDTTKTVININNDPRLRYKVIFGDGWTQQDKFTYYGVNMWSPTTVPSYVSGNDKYNTITLQNISDDNIYVKVAYKTTTSNYRNCIYFYISGATSYNTYYEVSEGESEVFCIPYGSTLYVYYQTKYSTPAPDDNAGIILYEIGGN